MTARRLRLQETKADGQGGRIRLGSGPLDTVSSKSTGSLFDHSGSLFDHSVGRPSLGLLYLGMSHSLGGSFTSTLALLLLCQCTGSEFTQHNLTELDPYPPCSSQSQSLRPDPHRPPPDRPGSGSFHPADGKQCEGQAQCGVGQQCEGQAAVHDAPRLCIVFKLEIAVLSR